ncbi:MAG: hypothetical protein ACRERD_17125, partial [Candidatus Binatia bacterium]
MRTQSLVMIRSMRRDLAITPHESHDLPLPLSNSVEHRQRTAATRGRRRSEVHRSRGVVEAATILSAFERLAPRKVVGVLLASSGKEVIQPQV